MSRPVIFLGYMGAGKTTVGKAFAQDTGKRFYDLDWYIETRMHRTVRQIFDESGEEGFRRIERNMLHEVAEFENVVVSCGGVGYYVQCPTSVAGALPGVGREAALYNVMRVKENEIRM